MSFINPLSGSYLPQTGAPIKRRPHGQAADADETFTLDAVQLSDDEETPEKQKNSKKRQPPKKNDDSGPPDEPGSIDLTA